MSCSTSRRPGGSWAASTSPSCSPASWASSPRSTHPTGLWRTTFGLAALLGAWSTLRLVRADRHPGADGPFRRHRWLVAVLYAVIVLVAAAPELAAPVGFSGLQTAALAVVCLVVLAHGLAWELLTTTEADSRPPTTPEALGRLPSPTRPARHT